MDFKFFMGLLRGLAPLKSNSQLLVGLIAGRGSVRASNGG